MTPYSRGMSRPFTATAIVVTRIRELCITPDELADRAGNSCQARPGHAPQRNRLPEERGKAVLAIIAWK
jgi:hypothetical protein